MLGSWLDGASTRERRQYADQMLEPEGLRQAA